MLENLQFFPTYHRGIREPGFAYGLFLVILPIISVKIAMTGRQSAGVRSISTTSEASQRLHAEDLTISPFLIFYKKKIRKVKVVTPRPPALFHYFFKISRRPELIKKK